MGLFRTEKNKEQGIATKPASKNTISMGRRTIKKLMAWFSITVVYGVVFSRVTQGLLDQAVQGNIGWGEAFRLSLLKSIQYGVLTLPETFMTGVENVANGYIITAMIENFMPLTLLFMANFYIVSIAIDVLDGREGEVVRYWVQLLATLLFMIIVSGVYNGFVEVVAQPDLVFNATEIVNQTGGVAVNGSR